MSSMIKVFSTRPAVLVGIAAGGGLHDEEPAVRLKTTRMYTVVRIRLSLTNVSRF